MTLLAHTASLIREHTIAAFSVVAGSLSATLAVAQLADAWATSIVLSAVVGSALLVTLWRVFVNRQAVCRESAVQDERRRLARDLHDGVTQELAFIVAQSRRLAATFPHERALIDMATAAAGALDESLLVGSRSPRAWPMDGG